VLNDSCGAHLTYQTNGSNVSFLGYGDLHDEKYEAMEVASSHPLLLQYSSSRTHKQCEYQLRIFPSSLVEDEYTTSKPLWYAAMVILIFGLTVLVFLLFDFAVAQRQRRLEAKATKTQAIVASLFPANVRDRMMEDSSRRSNSMTDGGLSNVSLRSTKSKRNLMGEGTTSRRGEDKRASRSKPIADLFPNATIMVRLSVLHVSQYFTDIRLLTLRRIVCGHCGIHSVELCSRTNHGVYVARGDIPFV
jgi:hypothetical protein